MPPTMIRLAFGVGGPTARLAELPDLPTARIVTAAGAGDKHAPALIHFKEDGSVPVVQEPLA
eukprot:7895133-Pyramimonas_sp.AAC.1